MLSSPKITLDFKNKPTLILVGNPNVGKSLIFNYLTRQYVAVSNYPGTTIDIAEGIGRVGHTSYTIIDTPGVNSLLPSSEDEAVSRRIILQADKATLVVVLDAKNLKRGLLLLEQISQLGLPVVVALNMSDEAKERGIMIDAHRLSEELGCPVTETVAITRQGLWQLKESIAKANYLHISPLYPAAIEKEIENITQLLPANLPFRRFLAVMALCGEKEPLLLSKIEEAVITKIEDSCRGLQQQYSQSLREIILKADNNYAQQIFEKTVHLYPRQIKGNWQEKLSRLTLLPITAIPMALLLLFLMYKLVGEFAAGTLVDFLEEMVFSQSIIPFVQKAIAFFSPPQFVVDFFVGEYGLISMALSYAFAIILPIVTAFFLFFGLLEDSGYLPRLAVLLDRLFHPLGLNGKAVLPFVLGLGCDTMATLTARTLETEKERMIATLLLALSIPCSAQLGVIMAMLGGISWKATLLWLMTVVGVGLVVGFLANLLIPGRRPLLIQELPPLRIPQISNILRKLWMRLKWYLKEAVPLFILGTGLLFFLDKLGWLSFVQRWGSPLVVKVLGLPARTTEAFLLGFLRRDYGAAGLYDLARQGLLDNRQILVSLVVITLFVPCIAQFMVSIKERGLRQAVVIAILTVLIAFMVGGTLNYLLHAWQINF